MYTNIGKTTVVLEDVNSRTSLLAEFMSLARLVHNEDTLFIDDKMLITNQIMLAKVTIVILLKVRLAPFLKVSISEIQDISLIELYGVLALEEKCRLQGKLAVLMATSLTDNINELLAFSNEHNLKNKSSLGKYGGVFTNLKQFRLTRKTFAYLRSKEYALLNTQTQAQYILKIKGLYKLTNNEYHSLLSSIIDKFGYDEYHTNLILSCLCVLGGKMKIETITEMTTNELESCMLDYIKSTNKIVRNLPLLMNTEHGERFKEITSYLTDDDYLVYLGKFLFKFSWGNLFEDCKMTEGEVTDLLLLKVIELLSNFKGDYNDSDNFTAFIFLKMQQLYNIHPQYLPILKCLSEQVCSIFKTRQSSMDNIAGGEYE